MCAASLNRILLISALVAAFAGTGSVGMARQPVATPVTSASDWWDDSVCYEVFVRSFVDSNDDGIGDLNGLISRLDYLNDGDGTTSRDLGVTCIWLMPIFTATSYHGYDVDDYYAIEPDYGTNDDFTRLLTEAHARGIRVILDLVLNHTSVNHPWFQSAVSDSDSPYRDWFIFEDEDPGFPGPWGEDVWHESPIGNDFYYGVFWSGMPDLNYRNPEVTAEAEKISRFWLDQGVDGFRLDAIKHLIEDGATQENTEATHEWLRGYRNFLDSEYPQALTIGEIFNASATVLEPYFPDQLHLYFQFDIASQMLIAPAQGTGTGIPYVVDDALEKQPGQPWGIFLTNHDQNRTMSVLGGDVVQAKLGAAALLTLPGLPFIYFGEEIGMVGTKPDERIRTPMQWSPVAGHGFSPVAPWQPFQSDVGTVNVIAQESDRDSLLRFYRALIQLHSAHPALGHGDFIEVETNRNSVLAFLRASEQETVLVVINFGKSSVDDLELTLPPNSIKSGAHPMLTLFGSASAMPLTLPGTESEMLYQPGFAVPGQSTNIFQIGE